MAKGKNYTKKKRFYEQKPAQIEKPGGYTYRMSKECADGILKTRKGDDFRMTPQQFLCKYVNEQYGLLRKVDEVTFS